MKTERESLIARKTLLFRELQLLAAVLSADVTREVLQSYVEILSKHPIDETLRALKESAEKFKFFPKPVEIKELIYPKVERQDADYFAGVILKAIPLFGYSQKEKAREYMGDDCWNAVLSCGGWDTICATPTDNIGILRAQLRDAVFSQINSQEIRERQKLRISHRSEGELKKVDFKQYLLGGHE
jgi:hypothetical protein